MVPGLAFVSLASIVLRSDIFVFYSAPTTGFLRCFSTFLPRNYRCSLVFLVLFSVRMRWVLMNCVLGLWLTMPRPSFTAISLHFLQTHTRTHTPSSCLSMLVCSVSVEPENLPVSGPNLYCSVSSLSSIMFQNTWRLNHGL